MKQSVGLFFPELTAVAVNGESIKKTAKLQQGKQDLHPIIDFNGQWDYSYLISRKDLPKYKESQGRLVCFDKLHYNKDGTLKMVEHTR